MYKFFRPFGSCARHRSTWGLWGSEARFHESIHKPWAPLGALIGLGSRLSCWLKRPNRAHSQEACQTQLLRSQHRCPEVWQVYGRSVLLRAPRLQEHRAFGSVQKSDILRVGVGGPFMIVGLPPAGVEQLWRRCFACLLAQSSVVHAPHSFALSHSRSGYCKCSRLGQRVGARLQARHMVSDDEVLAADLDEEEFPDIGDTDEDQQSETETATTRGKKRKSPGGPATSTSSKASIARHLRACPPPSLVSRLSRVVVDRSPHIDIRSLVGTDLYVLPRGLTHSCSGCVAPTAV